MSATAIRAAFRDLRFASDLEAEAAQRTTGVALPDGYVLGKAFRCLATGPVFSRWTGKQLGRETTVQDLHDAVAVFESGEQINVDTDHEVKEPRGIVVAAWVVDDGTHHSLAVVPAYAPALASYVERAAGTLWSSPEVLWGDIHDPRTGARMGGCRVHSLAITSDPAQAHRVLDRVRLADPPPGVTASRLAQEDNKETPMEEIEKQLAELTAAVGALTARVDAMEKGKEEPEEAPMADEKPEGEQMSDARDATIAALQARLDEMDREKCRASFGDRLTPAMRAGFDAVWAKGGERLVQQVYGALPPAIPTLRGHGEAPSAPGGMSLDEQRDQAIRARMSADKSPYHHAALALRRESHPLFAPGGAR